ncbi:hypothetical protein BFS06_12180 [Clostridium perfringens]|uniref:PrgI family protein n=1 Tax=Clostridium perfringens TaxID=1502 RepID=A0A140GR03_CLOPF|nr:PrgI family protein [Clostridium perfringens]AMN30962.1 hypothetical protein JFP838_pA0046 [Clostridium perfringens]TBX14958.1 hypothetical protein BFS06_12180 [Clostridium perfringens]
MGRSYTIPPDIKEKEKIIGGVLTLQQFYWVLGGAGLGAILFILTFTITKMGGLAIFLALLGIASGLPFAFLKKEDLPLYVYLNRKRKFNKKTKKLINKRKDV